MLTILVNSFKLIISIFRGVKNDRDFRVLLFMLSILLISSIIFFVRVEGWGVIDALYFSVMTMSTIGYGDLVPSTSEAKIFTIIYAFLSIGVFASLISKIVAINLERHKK